MTKVDENHKKKARLIFEDGKCFEGTTFALTGDRTAEVVFNTAMCGYQEVLTDPSYMGQMVVFTYPEIGNYGINHEDAESRRIFLEAIIVKSYNEIPCNYKSEMPLHEYLRRYNVMGVEGIDTRSLTLYLRERGACNAILTTSKAPIEELVHLVKINVGIKGVNFVNHATNKNLITKPNLESSELNIAVIDCGLKYNIVKLLEENNCNCTIFPSTIHVDEILKENKFDGLFLSNGPGDPEPLVNLLEITKQALGKLPIFGICMGHLVLGEVLGFKTAKQKFGQHGVNHPVKDLRTGEVKITSQNHNFVLLEDNSLEDIEITHINLNDNSVAGIRHKKYPAFSVQFHPEASPGPYDAKYLFHEFYEMVRDFKEKENEPSYLEENEKSKI
ncbi:glutamine-hydrolyzing carbamoyl-phosphate synthase small subunit [Aureivirga sp. CE67]|uniref:glutamine-hydrolyzing carbamoyl-phosphate synthase small subunit n=1 Tax=Aureivirga sp. CE67 TaxID=1788983 RepID=UPI0018C9CA3C|nr:glutamine-hydrolyzing carbamoyl-phosphate synthase small subunit [Aureivirga sp. CE67]